MIPIQDLLNRIRWDRDFARGRFEIGYYDRVEDRIIRVAFEEIGFDPEDHFRIGVSDENLEYHSVPYHRIREVWKDGQLIWSRPPPHRD